MSFLTKILTIGFISSFMLYKLPTNYNIIILSLVIIIKQQIFYNKITNRLLKIELRMAVTDTLNRLDDFDKIIKKNDLLSR